MFVYLHMELFVLYKNAFKLWLHRRWKGLGSWIRTNHTGGKIGGKEIGCGALKNLTQTSSADNECEPEQLFVLAEVTLKLAHLLLTGIAQCILPNAIVFNILKFCLLPPLCIAFNNWWKKWFFYFYSFLFLLGVLVKHRLLSVSGEGEQ